MAFKSELLTLYNLFHGRLYTVPDYQRAYRWEKKQRKDLFEDIERSMEDEREHLMSTVVVVKRGTTSIRTKQYQKVDVVDGQQRITTLIILYRAIINELDDNDSEECEIKDECTKMLILKDKTTTLLLQNNHDTKNIFNDYVRNGAYKITTGPPKTSAEKDIQDAIIECGEFARKYKSGNNTLIDLITHLNNKLLFVYQELEKESLAYYVFEGLNNRGLVVSKFDLLKTNLMQIVFKEDNKDMIKEIHDRWAKIYQTIGTHNLESDILRFTATLYHNLMKPPGEDKARKKLLVGTEGDAELILKTTINQLENVTQALVDIENNKLWAASTPAQPIRFVIVAIKLSDLSDTEKDYLCDLCIKIGFIAFTLGSIETKDLLQKFVELAHKIKDEMMSAEAIECDVRQIVNSIDNENLHIREDIMKNVTENKWYRQALHYLLYKYEEHLTRKAGGAFNDKKLNRILEYSKEDTIEHIKSQSSKRSYIDYVGNLFLLPPNVNAKLSDKNPEEKVDEYRRTGFLMADEIIPHLGRWYKNVVSERSVKIAKWACEEWDRCKYVQPKYNKIGKKRSRTAIS